ncbi:MAG: hypothetical protein LBL62_05815 [Planctomycetaceae bacterium]|jgi:Mg2+ and Co2+ transporter CorA|nr:hypothetical protein [Planctomycetaceae bacterium]
MSDTPNFLDNIIIIYPDFEKLKAEVEKFRTELSMLVLEKDDLLYQKCKNIEMAYMLSVGALEYKVYEIECAILRLKRKAKLIQAKKNRQEEIILSKIETILDTEFAEYKKKLDEQVGKMNEALERSKGKTLTESEIHELKNLYRGIVKALHPDLHPGLSNKKLKLFHNAVEAYEHGNLEDIRIISSMVAEPIIPEEKSNGLALLMKEKERLTKLLQSIKRKIDKIKSEYPYTMKPIVQSPEKTEARKSELKEQIKSLNEVLSAYTQRIEEMLR